MILADRRGPNGSTTAWLRPSATWRSCAGIWCRRLGLDYVREQMGAVAGAQGVSGTPGPQLRDDPHHRGVFAGVGRFRLSLFWQAVVAGCVLERFHDPHRHGTDRSDEIG